MIKKNILMSSLLITSTLIIVLIISIWANYSKNSILKSELRKNLKYDTINIDNNFHVDQNVFDQNLDHPFLQRRV